MQERSKTASPRRKAAAPVDMPSDGERPLKIGEAARTLGVEAYVLRFWETQFPFLRPKHSRSKHRFYDQQDLATLRLIKRLLHGEGYTIAGAKKHIREVGLENLREGNQPVPAAEMRPHNGDRKPIAVTTDSIGHHENLELTLAEIREDLRSLRRLLDN